MTPADPGARVNPAMTPRVQINLRNIPASVCVAVNTDAEERDLSVNDVVGAILAQRYGLRWESTDYGYTAASCDTEQWVLRIPRELRSAIQGHAKGIRGGTMTGCILLAVADHYGLPTQAPRKRNARSIDPAIVRAARERNAAGESVRSLAREFKVARETLTKAIRD